MLRPSKRKPYRTPAESPAVSAAQSVFEVGPLPIWYCSRFVLQRIADRPLKPVSMPRQDLLRRSSVHYRSSSHSATLLLAPLPGCKKRLVRLGNLAKNFSTRRIMD